MSESKRIQESLKLEIDTDGMNIQQVRLIKTINTMLAHVLTAEDEDEYFDSSSELLRLVASAVKKANFSKNDTGIEYSQQALEFCVDTLSDQIHEDGLIKYDN
ncbi:MAG: hypothetical protein ACJAS4_003789 [Bacteriovoracaceae bacterium]|jgi:hypothetical protein